MNYTVKSKLNDITAHEKNFMGLVKNVGIRKAMDRMKREVKIRFDILTESQFDLVFQNINYFEPKKYPLHDEDAQYSFSKVK